MFVKRDMAASIKEVVERSGIRFWIIWMRRYSL